MNIKIKAKIWKAGGSNVIVVPAHLIQTGVLQTGKEYEFEVIQLERPTDTHQN